MREFRHRLLCIISLLKAEPDDTLACTTAMVISVVDRAALDDIGERGLHRPHVAPVFIACMAHRRLLIDIEPTDRVVVGPSDAARDAPRRSTLVNRFDTTSPWRCNI